MPGIGVGGLRHRGNAAMMPPGVGAGANRAWLAERKEDNMKMYLATHGMKFKHQGEDDKDAQDGEEQKEGGRWECLGMECVIS